MRVTAGTVWAAAPHRILSGVTYRRFTRNGERVVYDALDQPGFRVISY